MITGAGGLTLRVVGCKKTPKGFYVHTCTLEKGLLVKGAEVVCPASEEMGKLTGGMNIPGL